MYTVKYFRLHRQLLFGLSLSAIYSIVASICDSIHIYTGPTCWTTFFCFGFRHFFSFSTSLITFPVERRSSINKKQNKNIYYVSWRFTFVLLPIYPTLIIHQQQNSSASITQYQPRRPPFCFFFFSTAVPSRLINAFQRQ